MWSNDYISIPFADHGRDRQGCDCWGLARLIYKEQLGIDLPTLIDYENIKDSHKISELYYKQYDSNNWVEVPQGQEKEFDIVVFKILGLPTHIGVVINKNIAIHCEKGIGTHITDFKHEFQWNKRLVGIYRYGKK